MPVYRNESCITLNNSKILGYYYSLENHSNALSVSILDEILNDHAEKVDSPSAIDNFSEAINKFISSKYSLQNCKKWKTNLSSLAEKLDHPPQCNNNCSSNGSLDHMNVYLNNSYETNQTNYTNNSSVMQSDIIVNKLETEKLLSVQCSSKKFNILNQQKNSANKNSNVTPEIIFSNTSKPQRNSEYNEESKTKNVFKTARDQLLSTNPAAKRSLGTARKAPSKFISPMISEQREEPETKDEIVDDRLKHIDPKMVELIQSEIIDNGTPIDWDDIAGLQTAKTVIQEAVVWPMLRPDIFTGLRRPPKGVLLFGPPGTGKTLIGKCVASQCNATFFNISASSLTSKWIGDGEKMVRALFTVARTCQPAVVFVDEIDSLLTQRSDAEHEATRRIKTEFLVQFDGAGTGDEDRILIIGATNRPQELDEAARRRLVKRLYIPLPDSEARKQIVNNLLRTEHYELSSANIDEICQLSEGYSGADMRSLCSEAAMGPIRSLPLSQIAKVKTDQVRAVCMEDFRNALRRVRPSVSQDDLAQYVKWNATFGFDR